MRLQRLVHVMDDGDILGIVEIAIGQQAGGLEQLAHMLIALFGERYLAGLFVQLVIGFHQRAHHRIDRAVGIALVFGGSGNDQRGARLVDQDGVDFVHDGIGVAALGHGVQRIFHIVAQIVEAELVVGAVGDVGAVGGLAFAIVQAMDDDAHRHAQEAVDLAHPFAVAPGEIVIDRDHMHAFAGQRIEIGGQGGDQGLAFAGLHFGDIAPVQHNAAHQLHIEMALTQGALGGLTHHREGFRQQVLQGFALFQTGAESRRHRGQFGVRHDLEAVFQGVDLGNGGPERLDLALVGRAEKRSGKRTQHKNPLHPAGTGGKRPPNPHGGRAGDIRTR